MLWWRLLRVAADATTAAARLGARPPRRRRRAGRWPAGGRGRHRRPADEREPVPGRARVRARRRRSPRPAAAARSAGVLAALAAFWRPDVGAVAALAAAATLLAPRLDAARGGEPWPQRRARLASRGGRPLVGALAVAAVGASGGALRAVRGRGGPAAAVGRAGRQRGAATAACWRLPFPLALRRAAAGLAAASAAEDLKDVLGFYLPLIGRGRAGGRRALASRRRLTPGARRARSCSRSGALVYLLSRADELHAQALLDAACARAPDRRARAARPSAALLAIALALILLAGAREPAVGAAAAARPRAGAPRRACPDPRPARGGRARCRALVARVQRLVPPGEPIYVAPRRSDLVTFTDPLLHFLVDRPNVLRRDVLLQARPEEQARIVAALAARRGRRRSSAGPTRSPRGRSRTGAAARAARPRSTTTSPRRTAPTRRFGDYERARAARSLASRVRIVLILAPRCSRAPGSPRRARRAGRGRARRRSRSTNREPASRRTVAPREACCERRPAAQPRPAAGPASRRDPGPRAATSRRGVAAAPAGRAPPSPRTSRPGRCSRRPRERPTRALAAAAAAPVARARAAGCCRASADAARLDDAVDQVQRPAQRLLVHPRQVAAEDADADQLHAAEEQQRDQRPDAEARRQPAERSSRAGSRTPASAASAARRPSRR